MTLPAASTSKHYLQTVTANIGGNGDISRRRCNMSQNQHGMKENLFSLLAVSVIIGNSQIAAGVQATQFAKPILTWEDYGCKSDDQTFDNGPVLSRMIADQAARKLKTAPVGTLGDYYIKTPINWPGVYGCALEGSGGYAFAVRLKNIGCTRIVWNGPSGGAMLNYRD